MNWSWKVGTFAKIRVYIHATFLMLAGAVLMMQWNEAHSVRAVIYAGILFLSICACVVMHDAGHVLAARHFGIITREINLLPIGGISTTSTLNP